MKDFFRVTWEELVQSTENYPDSIPNMAYLTGVSVDKLRELVEAGRLYKCPTGGYTLL
jgi:hypothetical protein